MGILGYLFKGDMVSAGLYLISTILVVFYMMPLHEFAHAFAADKLGDTTPRYQGRLSLNPMRHIDPIGSLMILLIGFGWAKPVQVNMNKFKKPKVGMAITAAAGPISNIVMAFICAFFVQLLSYFAFTTGNAALPYVAFIFVQMMIINLALAIFNLIPIPPLDGSRILNAFLPDKYYYRLMQIEQYTFIIILVLSILGFFSFLGYISNAIGSLFLSITGIPFS